MKYEKTKFMAITYKSTTVRKESKKNSKNLVK